MYQMQRVRHAAHTKVASLQRWGALAKDSTMVAVFALLTPSWCNYSSARVTPWRNWRKQWGYHGSMVATLAYSSLSTSSRNALWVEWQASAATLSPSLQALLAHQWCGESATWSTNSSSSTYYHAFLMALCKYSRRRKSCQIAAISASCQSLSGASWCTCSSETRRSFRNHSHRVWPSSTMIAIKPKEAGATLYPWSSLLQRNRCHHQWRN